MSPLYAVLPPGPREDVSTSAELRARTRVQHAAVEGLLAPERLSCVHDLTGVLRGWRTVWKAVLIAASGERAAQPVDRELRAPAIQALSWLQQDLLALESPAVEPGTGPNLVPGDPVSLLRLPDLLADPAASWGVAYVLRGSRLGGVVIAPQVRQLLGLSEGIGTSFLTSRGTDPGREWVAFRQRLESSALSPEALDSAIDAADWTFGWVGAVVAARLRPTTMVPV